jgi:uncharacterized membrane protein YoaK (UPF0700 family)
MQASSNHGPVCPQRTTLVLGISLVVHLLFLVTWIVAGARPGESATLTLLLAWSVAMGMQSAAVRWLEIGGVFTTAATATFIFLVGNLAERLLASEEHRRLLGVLASLIIGATAGGLLLHHDKLNPRHRRGLMGLCCRRSSNPYSSS